MVELKDIIKEKIEAKVVEPEKKRTEKSHPFQPESDQGSMAIFATDKLDPDKVFKEALQCMEEICFKIKGGINFQIGPMFNISEAIVNSLQPEYMLKTKLQNDQNTYGILLNASFIGEPLDYLIVHMVNVAIFAMEIGVGLLYSKEQLIKLGVAGLLHDIGMWKIPREIIEKNGPLDDKEFDMVKKHPEFGFDILSSLGEEYAWLAEIVLQEHERENGQGYPRRLKEEEINENAKIIGLADVYEAISHSRSYKKYLIPHYAVKELLNTQRGLFSSHIIKALIGRLSIFPLYSYVKLNSGYIGRVIEVNEAYPLRPTVEILFDPQKKKVNKMQRIKLSDTPILYITGAVDKGDLPDLSSVVG
ncbi:MAG: HD-GYP domain-containing protein [Desulfobacterales bacterium]|nr:HD-GYP domain-containing protein [Desulfobacterales bacterium]